MGLAAGLLLWTSLARAQAVIDESQETVFLWVDVQNGSDSNPGTQQLPFKTIQKSVTVAEQKDRQGLGTRVTINPGTYRENIVLGGTTKDSLLPETYEAATAGTVFITGADQYTEWTEYSGNPKIYSTPWPYKFGVCPALGGGAPAQQKIVLLQEMAFVNGTPLTQILSLNAMQEGTFFEDETAGLFYIWPPAGTDVNNSDIELADRPALWTLRRKNGVVLRGLTFEYSPDCRSNGAVAADDSGTQNILFDTDSFIWNNAEGLELFNPLSDFTLSNVTANHNGEKGVEAFKTKAGLWQNVEASYNNWRGGLGSFYWWGASGLYILAEHIGAFSNITTDFNETNGVHWDTNNENIAASNVTSRNNLGNGLFLEVNDGPTAINGALVCSNNPTPFYNYLGGLELRNTEQATLENAILYGNLNAGIMIEGQHGGIQVQNWETGSTYTAITEDFTNTGNTIMALNPTDRVFSDPYLNDSDWTLFQTTLTSDQNDWWNPQNSATPFDVPIPHAGTLTDFDGWQKDTQQDLDSQFAQPSANLSAKCSVMPDAPDYWLVVNETAALLDDSGQAQYTLDVLSLDFSGQINLTLDGISEVPGLSGTLSTTSLNSSGTFTLTLSATTQIAPGTYPITVIANSGSLTRASTFSLVVPQTSVRLSTDNLAFGNQAVHTTSPPQYVTFTNFGGAAIQIYKIATNSASFQQTNNCPSSLPAGHFCTVAVTFTPVHAISYKALLGFSDSDPTSPETVALTGTGAGPAQVNVSPTSLAFGTQQIQTTSPPQTVTVTNTGESDVDFSAINFGGDDPQDFAQSNNCPTALPSGQSCTIQVTFTPLQVGNLDARLQIADNAQNGGQIVKVSGTGANGNVVLQPNPLLFYPQKVGKKSPPQIITLFNNGGDLSIYSVMVTGTDAADFSQENNCGRVVKAGKSCQFSITFTPQGLGMRGATLQITDSDPGSPDDAALDGIGD